MTIKAGDHPPIYHSTSLSVCPFINQPKHCQFQNSVSTIRQLFPLLSPLSLRFLIQSNSFKRLSILLAALCSNVLRCISNFKTLAAHEKWNTPYFVTSKSRLIWLDKGWSNFHLQNKRGSSHNLACPWGPCLFFIFLLQGSQQLPALSINRINFHFMCFSSKFNIKELNLPVKAISKSIN